MAQDTVNYGLKRNEVTDDTLVALVTNQNYSMNVIDSVMKANESNLDIARVAKTSTGTGTAYVVDTDGVFDLTKDGNRLMFIPNTANTGSCTVTTNTNVAKGIRKANDAGSYVVLEAGDIKQGVPTELVWSVTNDFFILRPSGGGSNIKSIQRGSTALVTNTQNITITSVDLLKSIVIITSTGSSTAQNSFMRAKITTSTNLQLIVQFGSNAGQIITWQVIEFNNVKSIQVGDITTSSALVNQAITSVNINKCLLVFSYTSDYGGGSDITGRIFNGQLTSSTNVRFQRSTGIETSTITYYIIEFN